MPKSNHYYSKYALEDLVKEMLQFIAKPHPCLQLHPLRKNNKRCFKNNSWRPFSSLVPTSEKKKKNNYQRAIISPLDMEVQKRKKKFLASAWAIGPLSTLLPTKENRSRFFAVFFLQCILDLNIHLLKQSVPKSNHYCPTYEGSKKVKKLPLSAPLFAKGKY